MPFAGWCRFSLGCVSARFDGAVPMAMAGVPQEIARAFPEFVCRHLFALLTFAIFVKVFTLETLTETGLNLTASGTLKKCHEHCRWDASTD